MRVQLSESSNILRYFYITFTLNSLAGYRTQSWKLFSPWIFKFILFKHPILLIKILTQFQFLFLRSICDFLFIHDVLKYCNYASFVDFSLILTLSKPFWCADLCVTSSLDNLLNYFFWFVSSLFLKHLLVSYLTPRLPPLSPFFLLVFSLSFKSYWLYLLAFQLSYFFPQL